MNIRSSKYNSRNTSNCISHYTAPSAVKELSEYLWSHITAPPLILCIGTDRCIGDSLGPLTGTILERSNAPFPVYGTLKKPIHALNLSSSLTEIKEIHPDHLMIAVDASLGNEDEIGNIIIRKGPLYPGKGVGKKLPASGDLSIVGIVENASCDVASAIHNIRLHFIMSMAEVIASVIMEGLRHNNFSNEF